MPKKSKVNKLARMSDEERARYLQHRADVEEEARRRKRELVARFIKNKLDKEEAYTRMNTAKLNQIWRYVLRRTKGKQMDVQIRGMITSFNFMVERKDRLITFLVKAIEDSDDQHRRAFQAHTENISYFLSIGAQRLDKLQNEYEQKKQNLLQTWDKEEIDISDCQERAEFKLTLIAYINESEFRNYSKQKEMERATVKNEQRLEHEEDMNILRGPKQLAIEWHWSCLRDLYSSYLEQHSPIMAHYQSLREKDEFYQRDIARNDHQVQQATKILATLQKEWVRTTNSMSSKLHRMHEHKEELSRRYWQVKRDTKVARSKADEQMIILVDASGAATKRLEEARKKLRKIHQMFEICRKYEKENDNVIEDSNEDAGSTIFENLNVDMINECKEYSKMDKFLLKMNRVKVQTMCLKSEKAKLARENVQLKHYIKRYLTELALKNEKTRPVSMLMQSDMTRFEGVPKIPRPVTCIEGALCNAVMHEKRMKVLERRKKEVGSVRSYPRFQNWMQAS